MQQRRDALLRRGEALKTALAWPDDAMDVGHAKAAKRRAEE